MPMTRCVCALACRTTDWPYAKLAPYPFVISWASLPLCAATNERRCSAAPNSL